VIRYKVPRSCDRLIDEAFPQGRERTDMEKLVERYCALLRETRRIGRAGPRDNKRVR
jgi:hypothetical protein